MARVAQLPANDSAPPRDRAPLRKRRRRKLKYHAFLSYSHKDEEIADWLHRELEAFRVPPSLVGRMAENGPIPKKLTPIFRDEHELAAADDLGDEIEAALASTQFLIVLCSPNAASSHWTNAEIAAFKKSRPDGCILAAIAAGEPFASDVAGREDEECFPPALRQKYDRRGRPTGRRAEPLAADLRGGADERRMGFLKLVAGMLGVGLDELVQRETTQRQRRFAWLAAASLAGMTVTSGLAIMAIQARDSARDQRREAEGLVAFMLGDLRKTLEPIGKLEALDGVGAKVLDYYRGQDASELGDAGLMQRAQALSLTAQVAYQQGNFASAHKLYQEAMKGTAEAIRRAPDDPQRLFDHAQNVFYQAQIAANIGNLATAERGLREYRALAKRMTGLQPDNLRWRMEAQYADVNLGFVLLRLRRFPEAAAQFASALETIQTVAALDKGKIDYQISAAETLAWLADAEIARGNVSAAIGARQRQVALLSSLAARSGSVQPREKLIPAQQALGRLLGANGQTQAALGRLTAAVTTAEQLLPTEPNNSIWLNYAASAHFALADLQRSQRDLGGASANIMRGCALAAAMSKSKDAAVDARVGRWSCDHRKASLGLAQRRPADAVNQARLAVIEARNIRSGDSIADRYLLARSLLLAGDAQDQSGDRGNAQVSWQQGLGLARAAKEQPWESAVRADLLARLGHRAEAEAIVMALRRNGLVSLDILRL